MESSESEQQLAGWSSFQAVLKAQAWCEAKRFDLAERTLRESLKQQPNDELILAHLANVYLNMNRPRDAELHVRQALALAPNDDFCLLIAGRTYCALGRHQEAERCYLEALRLAPNDAATLFAYGALMHRVGQLDKARKLVEASLRSYPENEYAHSLLSVIHTEQSKASTDGTAHGFMSLQLNPNADSSHSAIAIASYRSFRPFRARWHAREAVRLDPTDQDSIELFKQIDAGSRWTYLPMYLFERICERLPGSQYTVWAMMFVVFSTIRHNPWLRPYAGELVTGWLIFCVYTWLADWITNLWIKVVPAK